MDIAINLIVGFGAAIVGGVAGVFAATYIDDRRLRRRQIGTIKAIVMELRADAMAVLEGYTSLDMYAVMKTTEAWESANFELAQFLPADSYRKLGVVYHFVRSFGSAIDEARGDLGEWAGTDTGGYGRTFSITPIEQGSSYLDSWIATIRPPSRKLS